MPDGTGVGDYIHVVDLARGHPAGLDALVRRDASFVVKRDTGQGYSVLDVVRAFETASGQPVPYEIVACRPGDVASCFADPAVAENIIGLTGPSRAASRERNKRNRELAI